MDTVDSADGGVGRPPAPLTVRGVPTDPNLRVLALATLVNTLGNGALTTTFALYFTHVVGLRATQVGPGPVGRRAGRPAGAGADGPPRRHPRTAGAAADAHDRCRGRLAGPAADRRHLAAGAGPRRPGGVRPGRQRGAQRPDRPAGRGRRGGPVQGLPAGGHQRRHLPRCAARRPGAVGGPALGLPGRLRPQRGHLRARLDGGRSPAAHRARAGAGGGPATAAGPARPAVRRGDRS